MGIIKRILYNKKGVPTGIGKTVHGILKPKKKLYTAECLLKYNGEPITKFKANEYAWSTRQAEEKLTKGLSISVAKVYAESKPKRNGKKTITQNELAALKSIQKDLKSGKLKERQLDNETKVLLKRYSNELSKSNS